MKYVDEFIDRAVATALAERIKADSLDCELWAGQSVAEKPHAGSGASADQIIEVVGRQSRRCLPKCAHVLVLPDEVVLGQHGRILFSGGRDNDLIRRISVKRLRQRRRAVAKRGSEGHEPELRHLKCDAKPFFRITRNPYPFFLQQLTEFPRRYR